MIHVPYTSVGTTMDGLWLETEASELSTSIFPPGQIHTGAIQGEMYRAPEVILDAGYSYSADIWSLGVLVSNVNPGQCAIDAHDWTCKLWDLLEGKALFLPRLHGTNEYDDESHLGQITALIGPRPQNILSNGRRNSMFYKPNGT